MTHAKFAAFAATYAEHQRPLWAYLVRLGASRTLAEDLTQEAFIKWLNSAHSAQQAGQVRAFLFTAASHLLIDQWRRERHLVSWDAATPIATLAPVEDGMISGDAWAALSPRERQLLWLAYAEEFSHAEIAEITGLAAASIKVLLSRARARLEAALTPLEGHDD